MTRERAESIRVYFVRASFRVALAKFRGFLFAVITRLHVCDLNSIRRDFSNIVVGCSAACIFPARFLVFFVLEKCLFRGFSISSMIDSVVHGKKFERSWSNCSSRSSSSSSPSIRSGGFVEILCHVFLTCFRSYYTFCRSNRELPLCDYKNIVSAWLSFYVDRFLRTSSYFEILKAWNYFIKRAITGVRVSRRKLEYRVTPLMKNHRRLV